jgi:hypothetical protein
VIDSSAEDERYFILGGILYNSTELDEIKNEICPILEKYKNVLGCEELKSSKLTSKKKDSNLIYGAILNQLRTSQKIKTIIYILDKKTAYILGYYGKKSYRYNKVIQFLLQDLIKEGFVEVEDKVRIFLDKITLSIFEERNLKSWLKTHTKQVIELEMGDSRDYNFLQIADILAGIPKLRNVKPCNIIKDTKIKILNPDLLHIFPRSESKKYLDK